MSGALVSLHEAKVLGRTNVTLVDHMIVATDCVFFLTSIERQSREINIASADDSQSRLCLLIALELSMHDVELQKLGAIDDTVEIVFAERDGHLVVTALPAGVAARVDDIGLEVLVFAHNARHLG